MKEFIHRGDPMIIPFGNPSPNASEASTIIDRPKHRHHRVTGDASLVVLEWKLN